MKKTTTTDTPSRKLTARGETLRILARKDLDQVAGGLAGTTRTSTCDCNGSTC